MLSPRRQEVSSGPVSDEILVCETTLHGPVEAGGAPAEPAVVIEVPHGATRLAELDALRERLRGPLPPDLADYFLVNTDAGAPELARAAAEGLAAAGLACLVLRCRLPRTLIDCNRELGVGDLAGAETDLTPVLHSYIEDPEDRCLLIDLYRRYRALADRAHGRVFRRGGLAVALHTYAPRAVEATCLDAGVAAALRAAYRPEVYPGWPLRPEVDLITRTPEGEVLADADLAAALARGYRDLGLEVVENGAYSLLAGTVAATRSHRWPGRVLCIEVRRDLLADPWVPFTEVAASTEAARRLAAPLAAALAGSLEQRPSPALQPS